MIRVSALLLALVMASLANAKDYYNDNKYDKYDSYSNTRNEPKSYTLSGDRYGSSDRYGSQSNSNPSRDSYSRSGAYKSGNQINNNGLIINREWIV
jgi:hypothetical protein